MCKIDEGREDTLLSKIYGSNPSFQGRICGLEKDGRVGERDRETEREQREGIQPQAGNWPWPFESDLGAIGCGAELSAKTCGTEVPTT
jgi:hypothetical protein